MKRIVLVNDSHTADTSAIGFACYLAKLTGSRLDALLLNMELPDSGSLNRTIKHYSGSDVVDTLELPDTVQSMILLNETCSKKDVKCHVHVEFGSPFEAVHAESRFADIMVMPADMHLAEEQIPSSFMRNILGKSECPVVISPEITGEIKEIAFCSDGSASSLFAMKQFTYLFPQYHQHKITVVEVRDKTGDDPFVENEGTYKWLKAHYSNVEFELLKGDPKNELLAYFMNKRDTFIVMGAFGRSMVSNMFKKSVSEVLIRVVDLPLFIAHQ